MHFPHRRVNASLFLTPIDRPPIICLLFCLMLTISSALSVSCKRGEKKEKERKKEPRTCVPGAPRHVSASISIRTSSLDEFMVRPLFSRPEIVRAKRFARRVAYFSRDRRSTATHIRPPASRSRLPIGLPTALSSSNSFRCPYFFFLALFEFMSVNCRPMTD